MKKFITFIFVVGWVLSSYSQKVIQLEETELTFVPSAKMLYEDYEQGKFIVKEAYAKQFESDAIKFVKENFDIYGFMRAHNNLDYDTYLVSVRSSKGYLKANYDKNGEIVSTFQKFKNIVLPANVRGEFYTKSKGWTMVANQYIARSRGEVINDAKYIITLQQGNKKDKIKIYPKSNITGVATLDN